MFVSGVLMIVIGLAMVLGGLVQPVDAAKPGLVIGGIAVGLGGVFNAYLGAPGRPAKAPAGMRKAKATILDATGLPGTVNGFQMVELTLELRPEDGVPTHVKRKFSAGRLGRIEQGRRNRRLLRPTRPAEGRTRLVRSRRLSVPATADRVQQNFLSLKSRFANIDWRHDRYQWRDSSRAPWRRKF